MEIHNVNRSRRGKSGPLPRAPSLPHALLSAARPGPGPSPRAGPAPHRQRAPRETQLSRPPSGRAARPRATARRHLRRRRPKRGPPAERPAAYLRRREGGAAWRGASAATRRSPPRRAGQDRAGQRGAARRRRRPGGGSGGSGGGRGRSTASPHRPGRSRGWRKGLPLLGRAGGCGSVAGRGPRCRRAPRGGAAGGAAVPRGSREGPRTGHSYSSTVLRCRQRSGPRVRHRPGTAAPAPPSWRPTSAPGAGSRVPLAPGRPRGFPPCPRWQQPLRRCAARGRGARWPRSRSGDQLKGVLYPVAPWPVASYPAPL